MRRRTTATSAAFGVLAIFLLLLSVSQGVPVAVEEEETTVLPEVVATVTESVEPSVIKVEDLPFADGIRNPCPTNLTPSSGGSSVRESERNEFAVQFYKTVRDTSRRFQQEFQDMLDDNVIPNCADHSVQNLRDVPAFTGLQAMNESGALEVLYSSILRHTAHAYFVNSTSNTSCPNDNMTVVGPKFGEIASKQKYLGCLFRMGATAMGYAQNYTDVTQVVLDERLDNLKLCSRREIRNCQVLKSAINLLGVVNVYTTSRSQNTR